jgi:hypothetical protein
VTPENKKLLKQLGLSYLNLSSAIRHFNLAQARLLPLDDAVSRVHPRKREKAEAGNGRRRDLHLFANRHYWLAFVFRNQRFGACSSQTART